MLSVSQTLMSSVCDVACDAHLTMEGQKNYGYL